MKYPHRRFLVYLMALGFTDEEVVRLVEMDDLVVPSEPELCRLRFRLADKPEPYNPFDPRNKASSQWLQEVQILDLVRGKKFIGEAFSILRSPILRHPVEILTLGGHSESTTRDFLAKRHLPDVSLDGISAFNLYLWDVPSLSVAEWADLLHLHPRGRVYEGLLSGGPEQALKMADVFVNRLRKPQVIKDVPVRFRSQG